MIRTENIDRLKFFLQVNNGEQYLIIPENKNHTKKIQKFLLNNGFVWNGQEKWIDPENIKSFYIFYTKNKKVKFRMLFSLWGSVPNERTIDITDILKNTNKNKFIDDLFKDII